MFVHSRLGAHSCSARCSFMLASLLIHVQLAAYWCLARCPLMLSFLSALGTDRKIINTNLKSPFRKGGIETRNMRNFANYHVDVRRHTSGVVKTICEQCLPTRHNKRDRSLRVNIDTGHCHCYHCGADFYVPDDAEEREKAERQAARKRRAASAVPVRCSTLRRRRFPKLRSVGW